MATTTRPSKATTLDVLAHVATLKLPEFYTETSSCTKSLSFASSTSKATATSHPAVYLKSLYSNVCCKDGGKDYEAIIQAKILEIKPNTKGMSDYDMETSRSVRQSDLTEMRRLHQAGYSFNTCNKFGESLLHMACRRGDAEVIRFLIHQAAVDVNIVDDTGRTCIHDALWTSQPKFEALDVLMRAVAPELLLAKDTRGHTPFDYARKEHLESWTCFLQEREDVLRRRLRLSMLIN